MKKLVLVIMLVTSTLYADNNIIVIDGEKDSNVVEMLIKGNGEECKVSMDSAGVIIKTNCIQLTNSKGIKILCTKKKKTCKTISEMRNASSRKDTKDLKDRTTKYYDKKTGKTTTVYWDTNHIEEEINGRKTTFRYYDHKTGKTTTVVLDSEPVEEDIIWDSEPIIPSRVQKAVSESNIGFLQNQRYVCVNQGMMTEDKIVPVMSSEDAFKYPTRIEIDSKNILHTDGKKDLKLPHIKDMTYGNDDMKRILFIENNKRYMIDIVKKIGVPILYICTETSNWTVGR